MMFLFALACSPVAQNGYEPDSSVPHVDTGDESDADTDADTDTDTDTDSDTDTDPEAVAWSGDYDLPDDGLAIWGDLEGDYVGLAVGVGDFDGDGANDVVAPAVYRADEGDWASGRCPSSAARSPPT